jgi:hypothetical protein
VIGAIEQCGPTDIYSIITSTFLALSCLPTPDSHAFQALGDARLARRRRIDFQSGHGADLTYSAMHG